MGVGEGSRLQLYPTGQRGLTTEEERAVQARRPPGREREKAVLVRVHHHHRHHRHHLRDHHRPPPPAARAAAHSGEGSRAAPRGRDPHGQPRPDCKGWGRGDPRGAVWLLAAEGPLLSGGPGGGDRRGAGRRGGQEGLLVSMASLPMGCRGGVGKGSRGRRVTGREGGGRAQRLGTYHQTR